MTLPALLLLLTLVTNVLLDHLGLGELRESRRRIVGLFAPGMVIGLLLFFAGIVHWFIVRWLLIPTGALVLSIPLAIVVFSALIAAAVLLTVRVIPSSTTLAADALVRIGVTVFVLGLPIAADAESLTATDIVLVTLGTGVGFAVITALYGAIEDRLRLEPVPAGVRGLPAVILNAGLIALAIIATDVVLLQSLGG